MAFAAAAIPLAVSLLGAMGKKEEGAPQAAAPAPPTLGQMFASNADNYSQGMNFALPEVNPYQGGPVGGGQRGNNG
jgi:hypothetical protein